MLLADDVELDEATLVGQGCENVNVGAFVHVANDKAGGVHARFLENLQLVDANGAAGDFHAASSGGVGGNCGAGALLGDGDGLEDLELDGLHAGAVDGGLEDAATALAIAHALLNFGGDVVGQPLNGIVVHEIGNVRLDIEARCGDDVHLRRLGKAGQHV